MKQSLRDRVGRRANSACEYCHMPQQFDELPFEIDHIIASKHGGSATSDNLALSCNAYKGPNIAGVDPHTGRTIPLFHPRRDQWKEHFQWDGPELRGRTEIGRATIAVLRINELDRLRLRSALIEEGVFPPA